MNFVSSFFASAEVVSVKELVGSLIKIELQKEVPLCL
jgi:hypothetical protein